MNDRVIDLKSTDMANMFQIVKDSNEIYLFNLNDTITINQTDISQGYFKVHQVQAKESYHSISYQYYNTPKLWWVITKFNNIDNVIDLPKIGTTLKILNQEYVSGILSQVALVKNK